MGACRKSPHWSTWALLATWLPPVLLVSLAHWAPWGPVALLVLLGLRPPLLTDPTWALLGGRLTRMAIGLLGRLAHCPQWPPFELTQWPAGLLGYCLPWGAYWAPWAGTGFLGSLPALPAGSLGAAPTESPCPLGRPACTGPPWLTGCLAAALTAPGAAGLAHWSVGAAKSRPDRGSSAPPLTLNRKVLPRILNFLPKRKV